jgi:hypothetical protein
MLITVTYVNQFVVIVKVDEMGRACSTNGKNMNAYRIFVRKTEGNILLGRPRRKWVDNIKMDLTRDRIG